MSAPDTLKAIKGFKSDLTCRGYQFEIGKTYEHEGAVEACASGFHACDAEQHPLEVFAHYPPAGSRYCDVTLAGALHTDDSIKFAAARITIGLEISIHALIARAIDYVFARANKAEGQHTTGDCGASSATGYCGASSATGDCGASSATGNRGASSATGNRGASSATGNRGASSATGYCGASSATGYYGKAKAANSSAAMTNGRGGRVMGETDGCPLYAAERDEAWNLLSVACGVTGRDGIKAGVWYSCKGGQLVEVSE